MFDNDGFSLSPIQFFQMSLDCHRLKKPSFSLALTKSKFYEMPDTSSLMNEDSFAKLYMGWSKDGIELYISVEEPITRCSYPDVTDGDSIELFFDTRDLKTSGFNTRFCHHFFFLPEAIDGHISGEITKFRSEDAHELCQSDELKLKIKKSPTSYSLEIFIPSQCLQGYEPEQFDRLGFSYRINRAGGRPQEFSATSAEYQVEQQPSLWASLKLVD